MTHKELIERLRVGENYRELTVLADEAAEMIESVIAERDEYQQAADKMAMEHKVERDTLIQRVAELEDQINDHTALCIKRFAEVTREREALRQQLAEANSEVEMWKATANASVDFENSRLHQQLAEAQALIEASRKQEPITKVSNCATLYQNRRFSILGFTNSPIEIDTPLYAAPVVADDVLKQIADAAFKHGLSLVKTADGFDLLRLGTATAGMGGAA